MIADIGQELLRFRRLARLRPCPLHIRERVDGPQDLRGQHAVARSTTTPYRASATSSRRSRASPSPTTTSKRAGRRARYLVLRSQTGPSLLFVARLPAAPGRPAYITRGSALSLPFRDGALSAVVTDPPYDAMIDYSDASDLFYVWLKRAMSTTAPDISFTVDPNGVQEKTDEIIVKKGGTQEQRLPHARTLRRPDLQGVSPRRGESCSPTEWSQSSSAMGSPRFGTDFLGRSPTQGLVLTGSWPAKTEKGGKVGFSNIVTTLTMACRPAPARHAPRVEPTSWRTRCARRCVPGYPQLGSGGARADGSIDGVRRTGDGE